MQKKIKYYVWNPWVIFPGALLKYFTRLCFSKSPDDITPQYSLVSSDLNCNASKSYQSNYSSIMLISRKRYTVYNTACLIGGHNFDVHKVQYLDLIGLLLSKILNPCMLHSDLSYFQARGQDM